MIKYDYIRGKELIKKEFEMILNQAQAEAVYSAMCALNNVGEFEGAVTIKGPKESNRARFYDFGMVVVSRINNVTHAVLEQVTYPNQSAFATDYNLN